MESDIHDIHICGLCKGQFTDLHDFINHKKAKACQTHLDENSAGQSIEARSEESILQGEQSTEVLTTDQPYSTFQQPLDFQNESPVITGLSERSSADAMGYMQDQLVQDISSPSPDDETDNNMTMLAPLMPSTSEVSQLASTGTECLSTQSDPATLTNSQQTQVQVLSIVEGLNGKVNYLLSQPAGQPQQQTNEFSIVGSANDHDYPQLQHTSALSNVLQIHPDGQVQILTAVSAQSPSKTSKKKAKDTPIKRFPCTYKDCAFVSAYAKDLERHTRIHTGEKPFKCPTCSREFNRGDKLKVHQRIHTGDRPYKCSLCPYSASDSSSMKKHHRVHTNERPFKCQICPYASRNSSQLVVHLRTHTGDSPFQCQTCEAKFKIRSDLKRHQRLHTGEKPYGCDLCDYKCAIKGNLKTHYRINHNEQNMSTCDLCGFQTSSVKAMKEHARIHESGNLSFGCLECDYRCHNKATLKVHSRVHGTERPYKCNWCPYSSKQSSNIRTHIRRKHPEKHRGYTLEELRKTKKKKVPTATLR